MGGVALSLGPRILGRATVALALALGGPAGAQAEFDAALSLVGEGRFREALARADAEEDEVLRQQARFYVLHHGGDLRGALRAGLAGVEAAPDDLWLLERSLSVALDLGSARLSGELSVRFDRALAKAAAPDAEGWLRAARSHREAAEVLRASEERRERALGRARTTVALVLLAAGAVLVVFARG